MKETGLWQILRPHFLLWGECDRVENVVSSGMSDIYYNFNGKTGWVETKLEKNGMLYFEKFQPNWMRKHVRQQGRIFVITIDKNEAIHVYPAGVILALPLVPYDKWSTVNVTDVRAVMSMPKPYKSWKSLREILTS